MKKYAIAVIICVFPALTLTLTGCGGGGGGGSAPVTKAVAKLYLFGNMSSPASFGNMSSNAKIATVRTTMTVPSGVMLNYSSAPGATSGLCILRKGVIVPSGKVQVSAADFNLSTFDIASRILTVNMVNNGRVQLKSSTTGNGVEFAALNLTLAAPGVTPSAIPLEDQNATIGEELPDLSLAYLPGRKINFLTSFQ